MYVNRTDKPSPKDEITFSLPQIVKFKLENGLQVLSIRKNKLPIIRLNLVVNAGSKFDPENKKGLANLFAMAVDEGAGNYSALELSEEFNFLGSNFGVNANHDRIHLSLQSLTENFDRSLELFGMIIMQPQFNEDDFLRQQRKILTHLLQLKDEPDEIADNIFSFNVMGKSNYYAFPTNGYENDIKNISVEDMINHYRKFFAPDNSTLIVVGNLEKNELAEKLNSVFSKWRTKSVTHKLSLEIKNNQRQIFLADKKDSVQSEIRMGHLSSPRNQKEYFKKVLLNTILGGPFTSRINLNLREKKGYTYGASSSFGYFEKSGFFYVSTSVGIENTSNAVKEILYELENIRLGITEQELEFAKSYLIRQFPSNFETYSQVASNLTSLTIFSLPDNYFDTYIENVKSVTLEDIKQTAIENIFPDKATIVIVGDKEKLIPQLRKEALDDFILADYAGNPILP